MDKPFFPRQLYKIGYQDPSIRRDLWAQPRVPLGLEPKWTTRVSLFYHRGRPRLVVGNSIPTQVLMNYATGPAFKVPPAAVIACDGDEVRETLIFQDGEYKDRAKLLSFGELAGLWFGETSRQQAIAIVTSINDRNSKWLNNPLSQAIVGALPRIFPGGTLILYELLQNAADAGARKTIFNLTNGCLEFLHDGDPFTENDVDAIAFVNLSFKPAETIGFMGLGFKSVYEVSSRPEIHSHPYYFFFDANQKGGALLPIFLQEDDKEALPEGFTTLIRLPLKSEFHVQLESELRRFDGRLLLYIGGRLREIKTPYDGFTLNSGQEKDGIRKLNLLHDNTKEKKTFVIFHQDFIPSERAVLEFAQTRNTDAERYSGRTQRVSIAVETREGTPLLDKIGLLHVFLPTSISLPFPFDVQGNFLVDASRQQLRHTTGPWNSEHLGKVGALLVDLLRYAKTQRSYGNDNWTSFYDLIPLWDEVAKSSSIFSQNAQNVNCPSAASSFKELMTKEGLVPAVGKTGECTFVKPDQATCVEPKLEMIFQPTDLTNVFDVSPLLVDLSERAKAALRPLISSKIGVNELIERLKLPGWEKKVTPLAKELNKPEARRQLILILAYLKTHEREVNDPLAFEDCLILLNDSARLRTSNEQTMRPIRCLPSSELDFPLEELSQQYDMVHHTLLRDLRRPTESGLEPSVAQNALALLSELAPELTVSLIASEIISPAFEDENWRNIPDDRLLRYTRFLIENASKTVKPGWLKVKDRSSERLYAPPNEVYFGKEYSLAGELMERICGSSAGIKFLSGDYINLLTKMGLQEGLNFFTRIGVSSRPRIYWNKVTVSSSDIERVRTEVQDKDLPDYDLRASWFDDTQMGDGIPYRSYLIDDYILDKNIITRIRQLYRDKPPGWKEGLLAFAALLDANWPYYSPYSHKGLRYVFIRSNYVNRETKPAPTSFGQLLRGEPWLPALDAEESFVPCQLVNPTECNKQTAGNATIFSARLFENSELISFLQIQVVPSESTPIARLRGLVQRKNTDLDEFKSTYQDIAADSDTTDQELRQIFTTEKLIFVPDHEEKYLSSKRVIFKERTNLFPFLAPIGEAYGELKMFFCERLAIPTDEEIEHQIAFLKDFVWIKQPSMTYSLRDTIESSYRLLLNYLNDQPTEQLTKAQSELLAQFGGRAIVYTGEKNGWVNSFDRLVLYPDTTNYLDIVENKANIPIESLIKRIERPVSEKRPLLQLLNIKLLSEAIREEFYQSESQLDQGSELLRQHLGLLSSVVLSVVRSHNEDLTFSRPRISQFLKHWEGLILKLGNAQFYRAKRVEVVVSNSDTGEEIHRGDVRAYIHESGTGITVYITKDVLSVYDVLAERLQQLMRVDLLSGDVYDKVGNIIKGNIARLGTPQFADSLHEFLVEQGIEKDHSAELRATIARLGNEAAGQEVKEPQSTASNGSATTSAARSSTGQSISPGEEPRVPTVEEVLASLPVFAESSFGDSAVIELRSTDVTAIPMGHGSHESHGTRRRGLTNTEWLTRKAREEAYGRRGELWVLNCEKLKLRAVGRDDLAELIVHRSNENPGSPWDIESFEKTPPYQPILIEVKSTTQESDFDCEMSTEQIGEAVSKPNYWVYRVLSVASEHPKAYRYLFREIWESHKVNLSATGVLVRLPKPEMESDVSTSSSDSKLAGGS
jgi:hypothetical protein